MKDITIHEILVGVAWWLLCCGFLAFLKVRSNRKKAKVERGNCVMFDKNAVMIFEKGIMSRGMKLTRDEQVNEIARIFEDASEVHRIIVDAAVQTLLKKS